MNSRLIIVILLLLLIAVGVAAMMTQNNTTSQELGNITPIQDDEVPVPPQPPPAGVSEQAVKFNSNSKKVTFLYLEDQSGDGQADTMVTETDDKIYIHQISAAKESGQWVQVFTKDPNDTLKQSILKKFLTGISPTDCFIQDYALTGFNSNVQAAIVAFPLPPESELEPGYQNPKCPSQYSATNGIRFFMIDTNHPDRFFYFDIGQYSILAGAQTDWVSTFRVY